MPSQPWEDLVNKLESAQRYGAHAAVIRHATTSCDNLTAKLLKLLEIRARSFLKTGVFEKAQEDATQIRQWKPESVDGYLLSGNIYEQHGYYRKAMDVYDKGLATASKSDPHYQRLVLAKSASAEQNNKAIDFIKHLPLEPVVNILRRTMNEPLDCVDCSILHVSKAWNEKILKLIPLHFRITDESCFQDGNDLITFAFKVQSLDYLYSLHCYRRLNKKATFPNLKCLYVKGKYVKECCQGCVLIDCIQDACSMTKSVLPKLLRTINSKKLEYLDIEATAGRRGDFTLDLELVMSTCRHLISLTCQGDFKMDIALDTTCLSLQSLSLQVELINSAQYITNMFQRLPSIEQLSLSSFVSSRILVETVHWCPSLRYLALGPDTVLPKTYVDPNKDGLQVLDVSITESTHVLEVYSTKDVASILHVHAGTLVACRLNLLDLRPQPESLQLDAHVHFDQLERLYSTPLESPHHIAITDWIIARAPNLQVAHLHPYAITERMIQSLKQLHRLHTLSVSLESDDVPLLQSLIAHHQDLGAQSSLTTLELRLTGIYKGLVDDLVSITQLPRIKTLKLDVSGVLDRTLARFINAFATTSSQLECFKLISSDRTCLFRETLTGLSQFPNLRRLTLEGFDFENGIKSLQGCHHLQMIELYTQESVLPMHVISSLKALFPFLKVVSGSHPVV